MSELTRSDVVAIWVFRKATVGELRLRGILV